MTLTGGRYRAECVDLGPGPSAPDLLRRVSDWPGLVALFGEWADGSPMLTSHPVVELAAGIDALAALDDLPQVSASAGSLVGGGWFGRLAYDGPSALAFHDHVVRLVAGRWRFEFLASDGREAALTEREAAWRAALASDGSGGPWTTGTFTGPPAAVHLAAVERAVELIRAGELYQVNVCTRLGAAFAGSPAALFAAAAGRLQPGYGAYLSGNPAVVSLSPELFLRRRGRRVLSSPIKGTVPRGGPDTAGNAAALRRSAKDVAENVMIVDLVRNDLGRVADIGTVRASALLDVRPHPGVWHLVSSVEAQLRPDVTDADLLRAAFPPGSVTGAPKLRAVAAIAELESARRGTYTGAVGFSSPLWGAEFSVAIRTFEIADGRIELGVGGGITADSVPMLEWQECGHKAAPLLAAAEAVRELEEPPARADRNLLAGGLLETVLGRDGVAVRLPDHLARLDRSCRELFGCGLPGDLAARVRNAARSIPSGRAVLRVLVRPDLQAEVTAAPARGAPGPGEFAGVRRPPGLWRHKWADRTWAAAAADALFVGADGTVLETDRGNVFLVEPDGTLVTPPLRDDLLPGVTRRALLDLARDEGRPTVLRGFDLAELAARPAFWTSSLSGAVPIRAVDGSALPRAHELIGRFADALLGGDPVVR
ncbi:MAG: aminodeoxychorismate synthase component I [Jatrophihabitans sp.]|uniref:aminodeoxychorismate synthase component I n=1 Tax=Jatrophihabitans sp. TaxID=1932789 RepID=UPI003913AE7D